MAKCKILINFDFLKWFYVFVEQKLVELEGGELVDNRYESLGNTGGRRIDSWFRFCIGPTRMGARARRGKRSRSISSKGYIGDLIWVEINKI